MQIPEPLTGLPLFYEKLVNPVILNRKVGDRTINMLVEPVQSGYLHACTPEDIVNVLNLLPSEHTAAIDLIVLRQPKRKENLLNPVWGRLQYWSEIHQYVGVAIHLEAQPIQQVLRWSKSLSVEFTQELERLQQDGHQIIAERRHYAIHTSLESIRNTQLYRTLPHEVGHHVDYLESTQQPDLDQNLDLEELYWSKPPREKEDFAHRYATEVSEQWKKAGQIPFERILNPEIWKVEGLNETWFIHDNQR